MDLAMEDDIRRRAYEIWEHEGRPEGREHAHWDQARREVTAGRSGADVPPARDIGPELDEMDPTTPAEGPVAEEPLIQDPGH